MHHRGLSLKQKACERNNCFLNVTILVSDTRTRKAPFICWVSKTQPPVSSAVPRCGCWSVRQWLVSPSPSLPCCWNSPHLCLAEDHTGVNSQKRSRPHH